MSKSLFDAMHNMRKAELQLIRDLDMYICLDSLKKVRRVVSYISNRYSKANNKYLKFYDPKQESKQIIYLDYIQYVEFNTKKGIDAEKSVDKDGKVLYKLMN